MRLPFLIGIMIVLAVISASGMFVLVKIRSMQRDRQDHTQSEDLAVYGSLRNFSLTDQEGRPLSSEDLRGSIWIADFIFTHCGSICPEMSGHMATLQSRLMEDSDVRLVSFSVDPVRDTPDVLKAYGEKFQADPARWTFLTGDKREIYQLARQSFKVNVMEVPEEEREPDMDAILHSPRFMLVDAELQIRGYYDAIADPGVLEQVITDVRKLQSLNNK